MFACKGVVLGDRIQLVLDKSLFFYGGGGQESWVLVTHLHPDTLTFIHLCPVQMDLVFSRMYM